MSERYKFTLDETDIPTAFYNIVPDALAHGLEIPPPLHPGTLKPLVPEDLAPIFPMGLIAQEASVEREIEIPTPVRELYKLYRPTPLVRARRLEKILDTPAHIYFKYEGASPAGSHKLNTAIAQAFYNREEGVRKMSTETGAGQWGSSMAMACGFFEMECQVYMVKVSYNQKPYRRILMETFGARVTPSPSSETAAGRRILAEHPASNGSLGIAISEAVEVAATSGGTIKYGLGSVLNHVLLHQTIVGQEAKKQMALAGEVPDFIVGCVGGGSNFAGLAFPFMADRGANIRYVAVEPTATPSFTRGAYAYDFGDTGKLTPLVKMFTLGHTFMPAGIHAGGLRYHGMAPLLCALYAGGWLEAVACSQNPVFAAAVQFARAEGIVPAPESAHAVRSAIDLALEAKERGEKRTILFNLSGHGHFDLTSYERYLSGGLEDYAYPAEEVDAALLQLPKVG